ncbi:NACHT domain-containing protein, partial [Micromonospora chalcea]|uniref:hypothetical protein n=1 Tax=Micromonospora chalcea TaxID=1874 RepID=UPI0038F79367
AVEEPAEEQTVIIDRGRELRLALCQVSDLRGLSRSPLICALMCEAFLDSSLSLPQDWITLVQEVLNRLADRDCRPGDALMSGRSAVYGMQQEIAVWAVHNEPPFDLSHLTDAVGRLAVSQEPTSVVDQILSRGSLLRTHSGGLAFVNDHARDHLAAADLILRGNINYLRAEARQLTRPRLVVAAVGHGRRERATELVMSLLDDAEQYPDVADALTVMAFCGATAAVSLEQTARERAFAAAADLVRRGDPAGILDTRIAPMALDMLVHIIQFGEVEPTTIPMAVEVAARIGESALPVLGTIARHSDGETQEIFWSSWSRFEVQSFARTVLSICTFAPEVIVVDSQEKLSSIADHPHVKTIEVVGSLDASVVRHRRGLTIRVGHADLVAPDDLGPEGTDVVPGEGVNHGI